MQTKLLPDRSLNCRTSTSMKLQSCTRCSHSTPLQTGHLRQAPSTTKHTNVPTSKCHLLSCSPLSLPSYYGQVVRLGVLAEAQIKIFHMYKVRNKGLGCLRVSRSFACISIDQLHSCMYVEARPRVCYRAMLLECRIA